MINQTLQARERLKSEKTIGLLFKTGYSVMAYPLLFLYMPLSDAELQNRVMVSVSKKKFKRAVKRNLIKRRMREVYRLHKAHLAGLPHQCHWAIGLVYIGKEIEPYDRILSAFKTGTHKMAKMAREKCNNGSTQNEIEP